jgi:hypothetical protein
MHKTFEFKEGTVIASVSEEMEFDIQSKTITETGRFTACLIGGTAPGIKPTLVRDAKKKTPRIFRSEEAAYEAAYQLAIELGYHPISARAGAKAKPGKVTKRPRAARRKVRRKS